MLLNNESENTRSKSLPKVSVIIPTYNRKDMLVKALDSVLAQDYRNIEIIVGDNASDDGTELIMNKYCQQYSFIKYMRHSENLGAPKNGQLIYLEATGEYMLILCDDDCLATPCFFSKAVKAMEENKNIALTRGVVLTIKDTENGRYNSICAHNTPCLVNGLEFYLNYEKPGYEHVDSFFGLFRKRWLDDTEFMNKPRYSLDCWLWRILPLYGDVYFIPEIIGHYYEHNDRRDSTSIEYAIQFFDIYEIMSTISQLAIQLHPDKKEEILLMRNPDLDSVNQIKFSLNIMRLFKSDAEI
ncbi:MAG: glycosyltransferase family 2 protein, partial [Brevinema sp.]